MLTDVLTKPLREKAGSDAYNRFEYQTGWVVFHVLDKLDKDELDFLLFCEFHDDVAEAKNPQSPDCLHFFQVKTKLKQSDWTLSTLTDHGINKKTGAIKHSFLGYILFNFMEFGQECSTCTFVSNRGFNEELRAWQKSVRDGKNLEIADPDLYAKLHGLLRLEFPDKTDAEFHAVFEVFCQNTRLDECELPLVGYKTYISGAFLNVVAKKLDIKVSTVKLVIADIWEEVRKKATTVVDTPISLQSLIAKKGITGKILGDLQSSLAPRSQGVLKELVKLRFGHKPAYAGVLLNEITSYRTRKLDVADTLYQDLVASYLSAADEIIGNNVSRLDDVQFMDHLLDVEIPRFTQRYTQQPSPVTQLHLRGVFYARLFEGHED